MHTVYFIKSGSVWWEREWDEGGVQGGYSDYKLCVQIEKGGIKSYGDGGLPYIETTSAAAAYSCTQWNANS